MQQDSCQRSSLHINETLADHSPHMAEEGDYKIVRASDKGWNVRGGHQEDMSFSWLQSWTRAIEGSLPSPLHLGMYLLPTVPNGSLFQKYRLERVRWCWDHLDWTHLRILYKLLKFWWMSSTLCHWRQASYISSLLKVPSTNVGWSAFFGFSCMCETNFQFHLGNSWGCEPTFLTTTHPTVKKSGCRRIKEKKKIREVWAMFLPGKEEKIGSD